LHRMHHRAREAESRAAPAVLSATRHANAPPGRGTRPARTAVADQRSLLAWTN
jgi:hypothetical protein